MRPAELLRALRAAAALELSQLRGERVFVALTFVAALGLLVLLTLFALTGSHAPLAVVDLDRSDDSQRFVTALTQVPHAFRLEPTSADRAHRRLVAGRLIGVLTLPAGFGARIRRGETVPLDVEVDNVNEDLLFDLERALPSAIVRFGEALRLPGLRAHLVEHDLLPADVPFLRYLAVSALGLVAFVVAGALAALAVAREWEGRTWRLLLVAPAPPSAVLSGKLLATGAVAAGAVLAATLVVVFGYGAVPAHPLRAAGVLLLAVGLFSCLGAWLGALLRRTLPIVPLLFGLTMPLFIDCGALEPTRFDGERLFRLAHLSPLYYVVGALQDAFFDVRITPEPLAFLVAICVLLAAASLLLAARRLSARSHGGAGAR
jgi:ABC-2 type transport system permease protein